MVDSAETAAAAANCGSECQDVRTGSGPDGGAVRQLVLDHYQAVYRYAFRLTGSVCDAEDATQQTFLIAQRKLHQLREPEKVDRWLFAVLRSCYLKNRRKNRPICAVNLELNVDELPEESVRQVEQSEVDEERLQRALNELTDDHKLILLMFYFEDLSYKEISARLNVKIGTVMSRLSRAKGWLRKSLLSFENESPPRDSASDLRAPVTSPRTGTSRG